MVSRTPEQLGGAASLKTELNKLLSEDVQSAKKREKTTFDNMAEPFNKSIVLFGAGHLGVKVLKGLRMKGLEPVAFADNNPARWGQIVEGIKIFSPQEAADRFGNKAAFIVTIWAPQHSHLRTKKQLEALRCCKIVPFAALFWKYPDALLPHYQFSVPHKILEQSARVLRAFALFADEESLKQYTAHIRWRLLLDFDGLPAPSTEDQYFPAAVLKILPNEMFVDCGAFDGDTIRSFIKHSRSNFGKIVGFEPDPRNFRRLNEYIFTLSDDIKNRLMVYNFAVGAKKRKVNFDAPGATRASVSESGTIGVDCVTLDEVLGNENPTFLKFDLEGSEKDALMGAQATIKRAKPITAICVYHMPDDLWEIPLRLHAFNKEYNFYLRTHDEDGLEIVTYAIPSSRQ